MTTLAELVTIALTPDPDGRPLDDASQEQLEAGRALKPRDMTPTERHERKKALQRKRARQYRRRQEAKGEREARERTTSITQNQLHAALDVTRHLSGKIDLISARRARKASRLLGTLAEDACFETFAAVNRSIAGAIVRGERDRDELEVAAEWLSRQPGIPSIGRDDEAPDHAHWLLSVIEYRSKSALQAWYDKEPTLESLAYGDSVIDSTGSDDYHDRFCADRQPAILGARWPRPGQVDAGMVQAIIAGAITARGLDGLVELILANLRSDGLFPWSEHAEEVFLALGLDTHWQLLCRKIESPTLRGRYARGAARRALAFVLPAMDQATKMLESGYWVAPDPQRIHFVLAPDPEEQARHIIKALEALQEALA